MSVHGDEVGVPVVARPDSEREVKSLAFKKRCKNGSAQFATHLPSGENFSLLGVCCC